MIVLLTVRKSIIRFFSVVTEITGDVQLPGGLKCVGLFKSHDRSIKGNEGANMSNIKELQRSDDNLMNIVAYLESNILPESQRTHCAFCLNRLISI